MHPTDFTIAGAVAALEEGVISAEELTRAHVEAMEAANIQLFHVVPSAQGVPPELPPLTVIPSTRSSGWLRYRQRFFETVCLMIVLSIPAPFSAKPFPSVSWSVISKVASARLISVPQIATESAARSSAVVATFTDIGAASTQDASELVADTALFFVTTSCTE